MRFLFLIVAACCLGTGLTVGYWFCRATEPISAAGEAVLTGTAGIHRTDLRGRGILR